MQTPQYFIKLYDELVTRKHVEKYFEAEGYDVFEATDGAKCIRSSEYAYQPVIGGYLPWKTVPVSELREQANVVPDVPDGPR